MTEYEAAIAFFNDTAWMGSRPGLARMHELMARLGNPERELRFVHVVGTNGKGSTCAMLASVLAAAGLRTGQYASPQLDRLNELMQIDGAPISDAALYVCAEALRPAVAAMADKPTVFERITAAALWWFARQGCDIVVLEAGMGGGGDATNVIPAKELAVFTNIGLDHTAYLGDTVAQIAAAKAGILTPGCAAVLYPNAPEVEDTVAAACARLEIPLHRADTAALRCRSQGLDGQRFDFAEFTDLFLPLAGAHQRCNAAVALTAVRLLRRRGWVISDEAVRKGLAAVRWPGRLELASREPLLLLDGGHNPQCIDALCSTLDDCLPQTPLTLITGVLADKDYPAMYARLAPYCARFFCLTPPSSRALPADTLAAHLARYGKPVAVYDSAAAALQAARALGAPTLCCGSLYLVGEIRRLVVSG